MKPLFSAEVVMLFSLFPRRAASGRVRRRVAVGLSVLVAAVGASGSAVASAPPGRAPVPRAAVPDRPNFVVVMMDDADTSLFRHMPEARRMQREGVKLTMTVSSPLCCPSRATYDTGKYLHNHRVLTNELPTGGWETYSGNGSEGDTLATTLDDAGYYTAIYGKYYNGYTGQAAPPGYDHYALMTDFSGYTGFDYELKTPAGDRSYGSADEDYFTDVITDHGLQAVRRGAGSGEPFYVTIRTTAPHARGRSDGTRYPPAPRHEDLFPDLRNPRPPSFDRIPTNAPRWMQDLAPFTDRVLRRLDRWYRQRAQAVQAVDDTLRVVRDELSQLGVADTTYVLLVNDNGYHLGQHRLKEGKRTPFRHDRESPAIVVGPGVAAGRVSTVLAQNTDLRPTLEAAAGLPVSPGVDGIDLLPELRGEGVPRHRRAALMWNEAQRLPRTDPDAEEPLTSDIPRWRAFTTRASASGDEHYTYAVFETGERMLLQGRSELRNEVGLLKRRQLAALDRTLEALGTCRGTEECLDAGDLAPADPFRSR